MPAVGDALSDDPGRERADFVLGDRDGTTCEPAFTALRRRDACAAWATRSRSTIRTRASRSCAGTATRPSSRHSLQIEVKRTLYMDEVTLEPNDGYARLRADLTRLRLVERRRAHVGADGRAPIRATGSAAGCRTGPTT